MKLMDVDGAKIKGEGQHYETTAERSQNESMGRKEVVVPFLFQTVLVCLFQTATPRATF